MPSLIPIALPLIELSVIVAPSPFSTFTPPNSSFCSIRLCSTRS